MMVCLIFVLLASIGFAPWAEASVIELPGAASTKSGVDIFSGWKCVANGAITVRFDSGTPIVIPYGSERNDTISICGDADNGYVLLLNYNTLGPGTHTAEVFDDGVSFASVSFTVVTTGVEFLAGVSGSAGPGPMVSYFSGKGLAKLRVPVVIVPSHLDPEKIDSIL